MAKIYISYKSEQRPFVEQVVDRLEKVHQICIDYKMPGGADWRKHQIEELRASDVFVVFISEETRTSNFQNAEIGSARFCSAFVDQKLLIPILIDPCPPLRTVEDLDHIAEFSRDPDVTAQIILCTIARRKPPVRLFISHAHRDKDLAARLVDVLISNLEVPPGELRCTSVPGYQLDLGSMAPEVLRRELGSAACVIALLTPNSLTADWVRFELGAAWVQSTMAIPLLVGDLTDQDIPGPFRGSAGGALGDPNTLDRLIDQVAEHLGWRRKNDQFGRQKRYDLTDFSKSQSYARDPLDEAANVSFSAKRARIGASQGTLIDYISFRLAGRPHIPQQELEREFAGMQTHIFYRLEQLRLLGFLQRTEIGQINGEPTYGWSPSARYRKEIGL